MRTKPPAALFPRLALILAGPFLLAAVEPDLAPATIDDAAMVVSTAPPLPALPDLTLESLKLGADDADRMTLPVEIAGDGPWPFIIDTGSQRSIVATELAQHLELPELPPVNIVSIAGRDTVAAVHLSEMRYGSHVVSDLPALSIGRETLGGAGLIGLDGLKNKRLTLDFRRRKLEIGKSAPARRQGADRDVIIVEARSKYGQLILVNSKIDGRKVNVILDTGAEISVGNMALFHTLKAQKLLIPPKPVLITSVTGQSIMAQYTVVRSIDIDSVRLQNVPMVFLDAAPFAELDLADRPSMLLGMKMLRMFDRVAIDFGSRHVDFQVPRSSNDSDSARNQFASR